MDLRIAPEVNDNVDVMPFVVDHPHIRVSGAGRRTKVPEERTRGPQAGSYGDFGFRSLPGLAWRFAACTLTFGEMTLGRVIQGVTRQDGQLRTGLDAVADGGGASGIVAGSAGRAWRREAGPCGVMACCSRSMRSRVAALAAVAGRQTPR